MAWLPTSLSPLLLSDLRPQPVLISGDKITADRNGSKSPSQLWKTQGAANCHVLWIWCCWESLGRKRTKISCLCFNLPKQTLSLGLDAKVWGLYSQTSWHTYGTCSNCYRIFLSERVGVLGGHQERKKILVSRIWMMSKRESMICPMAESCKKNVWVAKRRGNKDFSYSSVLQVHSSVLSVLALILYPILKGLPLSRRPEGRLLGEQTVSVELLTAMSHKETACCSRSPELKHSECGIQVL